MIISPKPAAVKFRWLDKQVKPSVTCTTGKQNTVTAEALLQACQDGEIGASNAPCSYLQGCTDTVSTRLTDRMEHVVSHNCICNTTANICMQYALSTHHAGTNTVCIALTTCLKHLVTNSCMFCFYC